ncbi:hypothetical protein CITRIK5_70617 [Citricoccus sp. K5]|nr:hypothetical protein CITRIK5_70617 [Citricoccus sp. K5]
MVDSSSEAEHAVSMSSAEQPTNPEFTGVEGLYGGVFPVPVAYSAADRLTSWCVIWGHFRSRCRPSGCEQGLQDEM